MNSTLLERVREFLKEKRKNEMWRRTTSAISALVMIVTVYVLIYPAIAASTGIDINNIVLKQLKVTTNSSIEEQSNQNQSTLSNQNQSTLPNQNEQPLPNQNQQSLPNQSEIPIPNQNQITTPGTILPNQAIAPPFAPGTVLPDGTIVTDGAAAQNALGKFRMRGMQLFSDPPLVQIEPRGEPYRLNSADYIRGFFVNGVLGGANIELNPGDNLHLELDYELPVGTLKHDVTGTGEDEKRNTFVYTMDKIKASQYKEGKIIQKIINESGQEVLVDCGIFKVGKKEGEDPNIQDRYKTAENKIFLIFDDNAITRNQTQRFDEGKLTFEALVEEVEVGNSGQIEINISDSIKINLKLIGNLTVEKKGEVLDYAEGKIKYTITIKSPNGTGGEVSVADTMDVYYPGVSDRERLRAISNVSVTKKTRNKEIETSIITIPNNATKFNLKLPQMKPGEEYWLTYEAKLDGGINASYIDAWNRVKVESPNYQHTPNPPVLKGQAEYKTSFGRRMLSKSSWLNNYTIGGQLQEKVKWTIIVNADRVDLNGWTLTDVMDGRPYTGTVNIYRNNERPENLIKKDHPLGAGFTFTKESVTNTKDRFVVVYYSDPPQPGGRIRNVAILTKDGKTIEAENIFTRDDISGVLHKWFSSIKVEKYREGSEEHFRLFTTWKISLIASDEPIKAPWVLYDRLSSLQPEQHYTPQQIADIEEQVKKSVQGFGLRDYVRVEGIKPHNGNYRGFKVIGDKDIPPRKTLFFQLTATDNLGPEGKGITKERYERNYYGNRCVLTHSGNTAQPPDSAYKIGSNVYYHTPVIKWDPDSKDLMKRETVYNYDGKEKEGEFLPMNGDNLLKWEVWASIPYTYNENHEMIVRDYLPEGVTFDKSKMELILHNNGGRAAFDFRGGNIAHLDLGNSHTVTAEYFPSERMVEVRLTPAHVKSLFDSLVVTRYNVHPVRFMIGARIDDPKQTIPIVTNPVQGSSPGKAFRNEAQLYFRKNGQETQTGLMAQTKRVFRSKQSILLHKSHDHDGGAGAFLEDNKIRYSLIVNPNGETLLPIGNNKKLNLEDVFSYRTPANQLVIARLDKKSVKVYKDTGTAGEPGSSSDPQLILTEHEGWVPNGHHFKYDYSESQVISGSEVNASRMLNFYLPDKQRLRIEYTYEIQDGVPGNGFSATNTAKLTGHATQAGNTETVIKAKISAGSASIGAKGIYFKKVGVDERATGIKEETPLPNVTFHIYEYKKDSKKFIFLKEFKTKEDGSFLFDQYNYNTAYRIEEVAAPGGYLKMKPLEFFVRHKNTAVYPNVMPDGFAGKDGVQVCYNGMTQRLDNNKNCIDIIIEKVWKDPDGGVINGKSGKVCVQLWRHVDLYKNGEFAKTCDDEHVETFEVSAPTWKQNKRGYPKEDQTGDPTVQRRYRYYIKEVSTQTDPHYEVEYSENNETGITVGTIVITNTEQWSGVLPETGGHGTDRYLLGGILLIFTSILLYIKTKQKRKEVIFQNE